MKFFLFLKLKILKNVIKYDAVGKITNKKLNWFLYKIEGIIFIKTYIFDS